MKVIILILLLPLVCFADSADQLLLEYAVLENEITLEGLQFTPVIDDSLSFDIYRSPDLKIWEKVNRDGQFYPLFSQGNTFFQANLNYEVNSNADTIFHIIGFGQSNGIGWVDGSVSRFPPITTVQPFNNLTFSEFNKRYYHDSGANFDSDFHMGLKYTAYGVGNSSVNGLKAPFNRNHVSYSNKIGGYWDTLYYKDQLLNAGLRPLVEIFETNLSARTSETGIATICNYLTEQLEWQCFGSVVGTGATAIWELNKQSIQSHHHCINLEDGSFLPEALELKGWASAAYAQLLLQVYRANQIFTARGQEHVVPFIRWVQGDGGGFGANSIGYSTYLSNLINDLNIDIKKITAQNVDVVFFGEQTQWEPDPNPPENSYHHLQAHLDQVLTTPFLDPEESRQRFLTRYINPAANHAAY